MLPYGSMLQDSLIDVHRTVSLVRMKKYKYCPLTIGKSDKNISHQAGSDTSILFLCIHSKHISCHILLSFHAIVCLPHTHSFLGQAAGNSICFRNMVYAHTIFYLSMLSMSMHMSHASSRTCMPQPLTFLRESVVWPPGLCYQKSISFS